MDYGAIFEYIGPAEGYTTLSFRREQAVKAFSYLEMHQGMIARYVSKTDRTQIEKSYEIIRQLD